MSDTEDFQWVIGKVPRLDVPGTEHSESHLGTGGLRDKAGKISALVTDPQAISPEEADRFRRPEPPDDRPDSDNLQAIAVVAAGVAAVTAASVYVVRNRDQIAKQLSSRVTEPLKGKLRQLRRAEEPAPAPESRQVAAPAKVPDELQEILDQTMVRRSQP